MCGFLDGVDSAEHVQRRRGLGFVGSWMGLIQQNTFSGAEDWDLWIPGWG